MTEGLQTAFPDIDIEVGVTEGETDPNEGKASESGDIFDLSDMTSIGWFYILLFVTIALLCCIMLLLIILCCRKRDKYRNQLEKEITIVSTTVNMDNDHRNTNTDTHKDGELEPGVGTRITQIEMINKSPSPVKPLSPSDGPQSAEPASPSFVNVNLMQPVHHYEYGIRDSIGPTGSLPPETPIANGRDDSDDDVFKTPKDNQYNHALTNNGGYHQQTTTGYNNRGYNDDEKDSTEEDDSMDIIYDHGAAGTKRGVDPYALPRMTEVNGDSLYVHDPNTLQGNDNGVTKRTPGF